MDSPCSYGIGCARLRVVGHSITEQAETALAAGLVNALSPRDSLDDRIDELVERLVANSPSALRWGKYALRTMESAPFDASIAFAEGQIALLAGTEDAREGLAAFNAKRRPRWTRR